MDGSQTAAVARGIAALAERYELPEGAQEPLRSLLDLVATDQLAPSTIRDPEAVLADHLADSLVALDVPVVRAAQSMADIGAGAGFPGLPLAIALPTTAVQLIESSSRKCAFIRRAIATCGISNARAVHARAEAWTEGIGLCDLVTARALAPLGVVAEYAAPLLRLGGALLAWRGGRDVEDEMIAGRAAAELGLEVEEPIPVRPYPTAERRHLQLMFKTRDTPARFPRRPGMAGKRPLGRV